MRPSLSSIGLAVCLSILLSAACVPIPTATPVAVVPMDIPTSVDTPTVAPSDTSTPTATLTALPTNTPTVTPRPVPPRIRLKNYGTIAKGPGHNYPVVKSVYPGIEYDVCYRSGGWLMICGHENPQWWIDGSIGIEWLAGSLDGLQEVKAPLTATPIAASSQPRVEVVVSSNIRDGPGTNYSVVAKGSPGDQFHVCGRNESGNWVQLCGYTNPQRWIYAGKDLGLVEFKVGSIGQLPTALAPPTPTPTRTPKSHIPADGTEWVYVGWNGTYQVWACNLELVQVGNCRSYTCPGAFPTNFTFQSDKCVYIGEANKTMGFEFPGAYTDLVITWGSKPRFCIDAIAARTLNSGWVWYGYVADGKRTKTWADTSNIDYRAIAEHEHRTQDTEPLDRDVEIVGPPDDDCSRTFGQGFILLRFLRLPFYELLDRSSRGGLSISQGDFPYLITGVKIHIK